MQQILWLATGLEGGLLILALFLGWLLDSPPLQQIHLRWQAIIWGALATCPPLLAMWYCTRSQWEPMRRLLREVEEEVIPLFVGCSTIDLALISILAGFGEEALFRGVIQSTLEDLFNPWVALTMASTLFGLAHFITPIYAILAGLIGLYLGWMSMTYHNLLLAILVHALYDFVALVYLVRREKL